MKPIIAFLRTLRSRLATLWHTVHSSLWFVPGLMSLAAAALALGLLRVDLPRTTGFWRMVQAPQHSPGDFVGTLLSSMITMTTLAISITMVVLTLAATQLGFRLIRNFIGDRRTQAGLGLFVATIVYLLLVLRALPEEVTGRETAAITGGTTLVLLSLGTLLYYVHHLALSIVADTQIHRIGDQLDRMVERFLPDLDPEQRRHPSSIETHDRTGPVRGSQGGYIQAIDYGALVGFAREADCVVELAYRPGHHILPGGIHAYVAPPEARSPDLERALAEAVVVGPERTPVQDIEYAIRQLVEIGLRSLSPSVDDAFTATAVIDRLGLSIASVMSRSSAERGFTDEDGKLRVIAPVTTFEGLVDLAFHQLRRSAAAKPAVSMHLLETLAQLAEIAEKPDHRAVIATHIDLVAKAGRRDVEDPTDRAAIDARVAAARAALASGEPTLHKEGLR